MQACAIRRVNNSPGYCVDGCALVSDGPIGSHQIWYRIKYGCESDNVEKWYDIGKIMEEIIKVKGSFFTSTLYFNKDYAEFLTDKEIIFKMTSKKEQTTVTCFFGYRRGMPIKDISWVEVTTNRYSQSNSQPIVSRDRLLMVRMALQQKAYQVIAHVNGRLCVLADTTARHTLGRLDAALHDRAFTASSGWLHVDGRSMMAMWTLAASVDGEGKSTACVRCFTYGVSLKI